MVNGNEFINSTCKFGGALAIVGYNDVTVNKNMYNIINNLRFNNSLAIDTGGQVLGYGSNSFVFTDNLLVKSVV